MCTSSAHSDSNRGYNLSVLSKCVRPCGQTCLKNDTADIVTEKRVYCNDMEVYIRVKVVAGARREYVSENKGILHVSVTEPAKDNKANTRVRELVAQHVGLRTAQLRLVSGAHASSKRFVYIKKEA